MLNFSRFPNRDVGPSNTNNTPSLILSNGSFAHIFLSRAKSRRSTNPKSCPIVAQSVIDIVFEFLHTRYRNITKFYPNIEVTSSVA